MSHADRGTLMDLPTPGANQPVRDLAALLRATAAGDLTAFAELYDANAAEVYGLALRMCPDEAEQAAAEVYAELRRGAGDYHCGAGSPRAWLLTLAHRHLVRRTRDGSDRSAGSVVSPAAPDALADQQRQVVELTFFEAMTCAEVAELLRIPVLTVQQRIRDGLRALRDGLGPIASLPG